MSDVTYLTTDLQSLLNKVELCQMINNDLAPAEQILALKKIETGLFLSTRHPEVIFETTLDKEELSGLSLDMSYTYYLESSLVLQVLKGFPKKTPLDIGVSREGLHLRNGENLSIVPWLSYSKDIQVNLVEDEEVEKEIITEKPVAIMHLSLASKELTRMKALFKSIPVEAVSPALEGVQFRCYPEEGISCTVGNGVYFAEWRGEIQTITGESSFNLNKNNSSIWLACFELEDRLEMKVYAKTITLGSKTLNVVLPLYSKSFPDIRKFQTIQGDLSFEGEAKQFDQALKGLLPLSDEMLPVLEMIRKNAGPLVFQLYDGDSSRGSVEVAGNLDNFRFLIRSDFLKEIKRLLKGKVWTWTTLDTDPEIFRVEDDRIKFWFRPMLDPRTKKQLSKIEFEQRRQEALEDSILEEDVVEFDPLAELL